MRAQSWILIIIALGCGLVASIGISQVMDRGNSSGSPEQEYEEIFVAVVDIPTGNPITPQMIKLEKWPKDKLPQGVITELDKVEKRRPRSQIIKGEPILEGRLINADDKGAVDQLSEGFQAVAIKVTPEDISGGLVKPGDRVNVLVYLQKGDEIPTTGIKTILRNVRVFAIGSEVEREESEGKVIQAQTVTLELNEHDAALVTLAQQKGRIRLTLRRPDDKSVGGDGEPILTVDDLLGDGTKKAEEPKKTPDLMPATPEIKPRDVLTSLMGSGLPSTAPATPAKPAHQMVVTQGPSRTLFRIVEGEEPVEVGTTGSVTQPEPQNGPTDLKPTHDEPLGETHTSVEN